MDSDYKTTSSTERYLKELRLYGEVPTDMYSHQYKMLFHQPIEPKSKTELMSPDALLGYVKDSKTLVFFQNDFTLLQRLFDMGTRSEAIMDVFENLYYAWIGEMRLTSALGGTERLLQAFIEPVATPYEAFSLWQKMKEKKEIKKKMKSLKDFLPKPGGEEKIYE
ncbi:MAG: hypothetical protein DRN24_06715 [Thermoplasmata archaeon]|nr:MAG: hypothetical protein DRN24_06715 [Thermoplasmata archaeon]